LGEEGLKIGYQALQGLVAEVFSAFDKFGVVQAVVRHIVPLHRKFFAQQVLLGGGKFLRNAEHLLESPHVFL
jgi:hypothetical protein